jgi:hypothetical protein
MRRSALRAGPSLVLSVSFEGSMVVTSYKEVVTKREGGGSAEGVRGWLGEEIMTKCQMTKCPTMRRPTFLQARQARQARLACI